MPVVGWICPIERTKVPFDHFDSCVAFHGRPAYSPFLAKLGADKIAGDVRHTGLAITATQVMDCPRKVYIERTQNYHVNPAKRAAMDRGTALHGVQATSLDKEVYYTEANDSIRLSVHGTLFGVDTSAMVDAIKKDLSEIIDSKFPKDWSVRYRAKDGKARPEYTVQLNQMRLLLGQQEWAVKEGYDPGNVKLTIWDHGVGDMEGPMCQHAAHMAEGEMAQVRPYNSQLTVQEHTDILAAVKVEHEKIAPGDAATQERLAAGIPLVGLPMFSGKKCNSCDVKPQCDALVVKYGVPK
jgi:hypothetical protein